MAAMPEPYVSPEEYLEAERRAETKSEYMGGEVIAMAGASRAHNVITTNIAGTLHGKLRGRPCETYAADMRVKVTETGAYTYPDAVVVCGEPRFEDAHVDTLLNPTVLFEVLSPSTESYDLVLKLAHYRHLASVREVVAVAQDRVYVQHWMRRDDTMWLVEDIEDFGASLSLESIGCTLSVSDIYERVDLGAKGASDGQDG